MINNANLFSPVAKSTKVSGLDSGYAGCLVNSKRIMEVTGGRGVIKEQRRMLAEGSRQL